MRKLHLCALTTAAMLVAGNAHAAWFEPTINGWDKIEGQAVEATAGKRLSVVFVTDIDCSKWVAGDFKSPSNLKDAKVLGCKPIEGERDLENTSTFGITWTATEGTYNDLPFAYGDYGITYDLTVGPAKADTSNLVTHDEFDPVADQVEENTEAIEGFAPLGQNVKLTFGGVMSPEDRHSSEISRGIAIELGVHPGSKWVTIAARYYWLHTPVWQNELLYTDDQWNNQYLNHDSTETNHTVQGGVYFSPPVADWFMPKLGAFFGAASLTYPDTRIAPNPTTGTNMWENQNDVWIPMLSPALKADFQPHENVVLGTGVWLDIPLMPYNETPGDESEPNGWNTKFRWEFFYLGARM